MQGAPSHVDTFDYKPKLSADDGKPGKYGGPTGAKLMGSPWKFSPHGQSGLQISEPFPKLLHPRRRPLSPEGHAHRFAEPCPGPGRHAHRQFPVRPPSLGAWTLYGLGTENADLPGFVALNPPNGSAQHFGSAFLPAIYQATRLGGDSRLRRPGAGGQGSPKIPNIENPRLDRDLQRIQLDLVQSLNRDKLQRDVHQPEVEGVIESFELAFRMQDKLPEVMDTAGESAELLRFTEPIPVRRATLAGNA